MTCNNKIWRLVSLWLWKEATAWTETSAYTWVPLTTSPFVKPINEYIDNENGIGRIEWSNWQELAKSESETTVEGWVWQTTFGHLMTAMFWTSSTPTTVETWVYKHSFAVQNDNCHDSYSIVTDWTTQNLALYNMLDTLWITAEVWSVVNFSGLFKWQKVNTTTWNTVAFASENYFKVANMTVKFADSVAWLTAASAVTLQTVNFEVAKNVESLYKVWSIEPSSLHNQQLALTWDFEAMFTDDTYKDYVSGWTTKAMRITIQWDALIGATEYPELSFDFANLSFSEWDRTTDNNAIMTQTVWFTGWYSISDTAMLTWYIQNVQSTQY